MFSFILFIILLVFIVWGILSSLRTQRKFEHEYSEFLSNNEGLEIFCYTSRKNSQSIIETEIVPHLNESISIIKLEGKEPITDLDHKCISYMLNQINNIGFPNVMKITKGQIVDISLHNEIYSAINNKDEELINLVNGKLKVLRQNDHQKK